MRNWFLSIEVLLIVWAFSGCEPKASDKNAPSPVLPSVVETKQSVDSDTIPFDQKVLPEEGGGVKPGSVDVESSTSPAQRENPVLNPYNTQGPNHNKVDSIKLSKSKGKGKK